MLGDRHYRDRIFLVTALFVVVGLLVLLGRTFYLQVVRHQYYSFLADNVRARVIPDIAPRGRIFDRNGVTMAESRVVYALDVLPYQVNDLAQITRFLSRIGIETKDLAKKIEQKQYLPYELLRISAELTKAQISHIEENQHNLEGVVISSRIIRSYPHNNSAAHVLGYVGEIDSRELNKFKRYGYRIGDVVGLAGVERYYDKYLKGINGGQPVEVDPMGNPIRRLEILEPIPGADLHLTIDMPLQLAVEKIMGNAKGAVVITNPHSGEVLAMVSKPDYNPNFFSSFLSDQDWQTIRSEEYPLHNRSLSGYPPGSTFKIVTFLAALGSRNVNPKQHYYCNGYIRIGGRRFNCWHSGHGKLDIFEGLVESCNIVFYNLGLKLDPEEISAMAARFGLGMPTEIDLPYESAGFVPTKRWKLRKYNQNWFPGDSLNFAIGQGFLLTSPLQMSVLMGSIANDQGALMKPFLASKIVENNGEEIVLHNANVAGQVGFNQEHLTVLRQKLKEVVANGTGSNAKIAGWDIAGKTGTAEVYGKDSHAWFVSYGPGEPAQLAMAVFMEHGGMGGRVAARVSREIYDWWINNRGDI